MIAHRIEALDTILLMLLGLGEFNALTYMRLNNSMSSDSSIVPSLSKMCQLEDQRLDSIVLN